MQKAVFSFELGPERNDAVLSAIKPEASRDIPRASARVWKENNLLFLEVKAQDNVSLRAAVNSYLRWVKVAAEAASIGKNAAEASRGKKTAVAVKTGKTPAAKSVSKTPGRQKGKIARKPGRSKK